MNYTDVPIWEKYTLTIEEASKAIPHRKRCQIPPSVI